MLALLRNRFGLLLFEAFLGGLKLGILVLLINALLGFFMLFDDLPSCAILDLFDHPVGPLLCFLDLMVLFIHLLGDLLGYSLFLMALVLDFFSVSLGLLHTLCRLLMALFGLVFCSLLLFLDLSFGLASIGGLLLSLLCIVSFLL